jgi:hypothetical protein
MYLMSVVHCQVDKSARGLSLVKKGRTEYGVSECGHEAFIMGRPWSTKGCCAMKEENTP